MKSTKEHDKRKGKKPQRQDQWRRSAEGAQLDRDRRHFRRCASAWQRQMETARVGVPGDLLGLEFTARVGRSGQGCHRHGRQALRQRCRGCNDLSGPDHRFGPLHAPTAPCLVGAHAELDATVWPGCVWRVGKWLPLAVDGSRVSVPRTQRNEERFNKPRKPRGKKKSRTNKRGRHAQQQAAKTACQESL